MLKRTELQMNAELERSDLPLRMMKPISAFENQKLCVHLKDKPASAFEQTIKADNFTVNRT